MWTSNSLNQIPGSAVSFKPSWAAPMRCAMCLGLTVRGTHVQLYQDKPSASHTTLHACCHCKSPSSVTILCSMIIATRFCKSIKTHIVSSLYTNSTEMPCHFFSSNSALQVTFLSPFTSTFTLWLSSQEAAVTATS